MRKIYSLVGWKWRWDGNGNVTESTDNSVSVSSDKSIIATEAESTTAAIGEKKYIEKEKGTEIDGKTTRTDGGGDREQDKNDTATIVDYD